MRFRYRGALLKLMSLRTVQAIYLLKYIPGRRPSTLLGDANFREIQTLIETVRSAERGDYQTLHLAAAGSDTVLMQRLKSEFAQQTGLALADDKGDLLIRLRPSAQSAQSSTAAGDQPGWDVLIRLGARPLATRDWRQCNYEGALNATVAHVMALLTNPAPTDTYVNLGCGSGSLLIERCAAGDARQVVGVDNDPAVLRCAAANREASEYASRSTLARADIRSTPFATASVDALSIDLPFGQRVGSHEQNRTLYPATLREAARIARPSAPFVVITHELRLMEAVLSQQSAWRLERELRIVLRGLHPRIFVLRRI
ncbi:MAG: methyltransferase domain-containing protein [Chloroflexi bacterium]|nr:methyltransferase domain-containing protein [Chloroflexota bacterium]